MKSAEESSEEPNAIKSSVFLIEDEPDNEE